MQDIMFDVTVEAIAKWIFDTYGEVAVELGYITSASEFGNDSEWDDYAEDYPQKKILREIAKKLLSTGFIRYNTDNSIV